MKTIKPDRLRLLCLFVCLMVVLSCISPVFAADGAVKVVFSGNVNSTNPQVTPYSELAGKYLSGRLGDETELVSAPLVDIGQEGFLGVAEAILSEAPDIVFWEINISKKQKDDESIAKERIAAVIEKLLSGEKTPAIYFIYAPEETFYDYRSPFDAVASYYGAEVLDVFSALKKKYVSGQLETRDFLTAGLIPGEGGHKYFADEIINLLKGIDNLTKPVSTDKKPLADPEKYAAAADKGRTEQPPPGDGHTFYVSASNGNDANSGTKEAPFRTLQKAKNAVKSLKKQQGNKFGGATVYLREGKYVISGGLALSSEDGGTDTAEVVFSGYPGERVRLTNASVLNADKFKPVTDAQMLTRIPEEARGKVLSYDLKSSGIYPGIFRDGSLKYYSGSAARQYYMGNMLTADGHFEQRAQYPNGGYSKVAETQITSSNLLYYNENVGERWKTADNPWLKGMLGQGYHTEHNQITGFDFENKIIKLSTASSYGVKVGYPWSIINLLEELDMPSEWYVDEAEGVLYYYPRKDVNASEIMFASDLTPIITLKETRNVTIKNIEFTTGCGPAVEIIDGVSNTVDGCKIGNMGIGVNIICSDIVGPGRNGVINSHIYNTNLGGVMITGGDRITLTPQEDYVENCHIENFSMECHAETGGVLAQGTVGVRFLNNNIHNDNSAAIWMGGNDDYIAYNEIYNVAKETDDYGAVYGDSRGAMRQGVVFRNNYMHDVVYSAHTGTTGIIMGFYADAQRNNGAMVWDNVFARVSIPIFFSNNRNMEANSNLIMECFRNPVQMWRSPYSNEQLENYHKTLEQKMADGTFWNAKTESESINPLLYRAYQTTPEFTEKTKKTYFLKYPWLEKYLESEPLEARYITVKNNAIFNSQGKIYIPNDVSEYMDVAENYMTAEGVEYGELGTETERVDIAMGVAARQLENYRPWNVREAGINRTEPVGDFDVLYPLNGQTNIDPSKLVLRWDYASGADEYTVTIATDPELKNVVFEKVVTSDYVSASGLEPGVQQWLGIFITATAICCLLMIWPVWRQDGLTRRRPSFWTGTIMQG